MTMLPPATRAVQFAVVDDGFWAADDDGSFAGSIDRHGRRHFFVRNAYGEYVGDYSTFEAAAAALTAAIAAEHARAGVLMEPPC